jgi:hypothetical protein
VLQTLDKGVQVVGADPFLALDDHSLKELGIRRCQTLAQFGKQSLRRTRISGSRKSRGS